MLASTPFAAAAREMLHHLPAASSSQGALLLEIENSVGAHRREIERRCAPTAIAPRPVAGQSRPREAAPLPPPPPRRVMQRHELGAAGAAVVAARPAVGTVTVVAGQEGDGFEDGPALSARFDMPWGMVKMGDGAIIIADCDNHRIRKLFKGVVTTVAGGVSARIRLDMVAARR